MDGHALSSANRKETCEAESDEVKIHDGSFLRRREAELVVKKLMGCPNGSLVLQNRAS
jgi:hypothetical protein